jgi:hypothetical protein
MNSKVISFSGMMIAVVLFFASGHIIGNQQVFAFGGYGGHGFGHYYSPGFGHYYSPGFGPGYSYGPGYPIDPIVPCGGGPYSIINGQAVCTTA